jgi:hypothetical protein
MIKSLNVMLTMTPRSGMSRTSHTGTARKHSTTSSTTTQSMASSELSPVLQSVAQKLPVDLMDHGLVNFSIIQSMVKTMRRVERVLR